MKMADAENIIHNHMAELYDKPCSMSHHLNRKGGLITHINNVMRLAKEYFPDDETLIALALIHDVGKARTYKFTNDGIRFIPGLDHSIHTINMIKESGYDLTEEEENAVMFHHGGFAPFKPIKMQELSIKLHFVDHLSTVREQ